VALKPTRSEAKEGLKPPSVERTGSDTKTGTADVGPTEKLRTLKKMLDEGLITQDDYDQRKKAILDGMK
jgi:hypothetical protein